MTAFRSIGARKDATRGTAAIEVRKDLANLFTGVGVLPGGPTPLVTGSPSTFGYWVLPAGWVTSRGASDGVHLWGNDGNVLVTLSDTGATLVAPGSNSRIDIIYAFHPSASENGDTVSEPVIAVAKGTAASVPVAPSIPVGALELARNTMTSVATNTSSVGNTIEQTAPVANLVQDPTPTPFYRLSRSTSKSISNASTTTIDGWAADVNVGGFSYSLGGVTFPSTGVYMVSAYIEFAASGTGERRITIAGEAMTKAAAISGSPTRLAVSRVFQASGTVADFMTVFQSSGATLAVTSGLIEIARIG